MSLLLERMVMHSVMRVHEVRKCLPEQVPETLPGPVCHLRLMSREMRLLQAGVRKPFLMRVP